MTRRPIPFSGSAFFLALRLRRADAGALRADATPPGQGPPAAAALCRAKAPARTRTEGQRSTRNNALPAPIRTPVPRSESATGSSSASAPLKAAPFSAPYCRGAPRRGTAMYPARPGSDSTHIRADRGSSSVRLGFSPRSGSENCPLPLLVPHSASALFPSPGPRPQARVQARGQKKPRSSGAKHEEGKAKAGPAKAPLEQRRITEAAGGRRRTCGSAERKSAQAQTTPSGTNKRQK